MDNQKNNIIYNRILANELNTLEDFDVEIVGYFIPKGNSKCFFIKTGNSKVIIENSDIEIDGLKENDLLGVQGKVLNKNTISLQNYIILPNVKFDIKQFEMALYLKKQINFN